ncbi:MAG: thioredoxin family protein [bacterium]|jgi:hypothetical protein
MFKIQVFGSGTSKCRQMRIRVHNALWMLGLRDFQVEVEGDIRNFPAEVKDTPGLGVNGKVLVSGRLPEISEIQRLLAPYALGMELEAAA